MHPNLVQQNAAPDLQPMPCQQAAAIGDCDAANLGQRGGAMKRWIVASGLAVAVALFATASWSDVSPGGGAAGTAPSLGSNGSPSGSADLGLIPYADMSAAEQAVIDSARNESGWDQTNDSFAASGRELATRAAADAAAQQLGMTDLGQQGVVP